MSRLDAFIRRMIAQRDCINLAKELIGNIDGPVLELGLGNGRTYDHLREKFPERDIYVIDRIIKAKSDVSPPSNLAIIGEIEEILPNFLSYTSGKKIALVNSDLGGTVWDNPEPDKPLAIALSEYLPKIVQKQAIIITNLELYVKLWQKIELPYGIATGKIFMYKSI